MGTVTHVDLQDRAPLTLDTLPLGPEDGHVSPPEAIDGLLGIAHHEQPAQTAVQEVDHISLAPVGVLELVDEDGLDLSLPPL